MPQFTTRLVADNDYAAWKPLFYGYAEFYKVRMNDAIADAVWRWLRDDAHVLTGLLTRDNTGTAVGMAHIRACPRPLAGGDMGFLDDMFVVPEARGTGAAEAIFTALREHATDNGWPVIRWVTQHYNERGRGFYDKYTDGPSDFIMYHWPVA
mgnify:CR=1 FL=1